MACLFLTTFHTIIDNTSRRLSFFCICLANFSVYLITFFWTNKILTVWKQTHTYSVAGTSTQEGSGGKLPPFWARGGNFTTLRGIFLSFLLLFCQEFGKVSVFLSARHNDSQRSLTIDRPFCAQLSWTPPSPLHDIWFTYVSNYRVGQKPDHFKKCIILVYMKVFSISKYSALYQE